METYALTRSEVVHARVVSVVHVVVCKYGLTDAFHTSGWQMRVLTDGVNACGTASIAANRAAKGRRFLCGGVTDRVTGTAAAALEGVVQTDPVANLVSERLMSRMVRESE